jgi:hypothetical protein
MMIERIAIPLGRAYNRLRMPAAASRELAGDLKGLPANDPGIDAAVAAGAEWLARAQDMSTTKDGGVAKNFSLISGWSSSYPETTGYIIPTLVAYAKLSGDLQYRERAKRMLDWLVGIQLHDGAFQAGSIGTKYPVPVTFNTGQILIGLACGVVEFGEGYREPMRRAAQWLVDTQDRDGAWRKNQSPLVARPGEKAYDTHIAWGLFEAARVEPSAHFGEAGLRNLRWAMMMQQPNGWFDKCSIKDPTTPATHTLGYALRGILEGYGFSKDPELLTAARLTADGLLSALARDGFLPGRLDRHWRSNVDWACLTGTAQVATNWMLMWQHTGEAKYLEAGYIANRYVRRSLKLDGDSDTRGAVKGSFPVDGAYDPWVYPNWATKFMIDSCLLEREIRRRRPSPQTVA